MTGRSRRGRAVSAVLGGAAGALLGAAIPPAAQATDGLCSASEQTLFSCHAGEKTVAVCATPELTAETGAVHYRFGAPGAVELALPADGADWRGIVRGGTLVYSGGGGAYLAFARPPYRYVVYSAIGQGWGRKSGVVVERDGKRIANLPCRADATSRLGPDLFSTAAVDEGESDFELP